MLPALNISNGVTDYHGSSSLGAVFAKLDNGSRSGSYGDFDDQSSNVDESSSSPQSIDDVAGSSTMCSSDLASLELSPPLTDSGSVGSDDRGIWMTSHATTGSSPSRNGFKSPQPPTSNQHQHHQMPRHHLHHSHGLLHHHHQAQRQKMAMGAAGFEADDGEMIQRICLVCGDAASGHHYGIASCEACKAFFKRTVQGRIQYTCSVDGLCEMTKKRRKSCPACRYDKCLNMGMNPEGIRLDRRKGGRHKHGRQSENGSASGTYSPIPGGLQSPGIESVHTMLTQNVQARGENRMLSRLLSIEPPKVFATPDSSMPDGAQKFMTSLSNLADRELVATISWAKHIPGFSSLPLTDEMNMIQTSWNHLLCFNLSYRSATPKYEGYLVFSDDLKVSESESAGVGLWPELDNVARGLAKKINSLRLTHEEFVLMKAIILLSTEIELENPVAVETLRDQLFDSLLEYESVHCGAEVFHRVGRLMLLLPMLTHEVVIARHYWHGVKLTGAVDANRLLNEMVESSLRDCILDDDPPTLL